MKKSITILLVDDHTLFRDGIKAIFRPIKDICIVAEASNGSEAIEMLKLLPFNLVLLNVNRTVLSEMNTVKYINANYPETKILALSSHEDTQIIQRMMENGASGYLSKNIGKKELIHAIRTVYSGARYYCEKADDILMEQTVSDQQQGYETTKTENPVLSKTDFTSLNRLMP